MSAVILPNGSLIFRLPDQTVHVDVQAKEIQVRDGSGRGEFEGRVLLRFPLGAASLVRLLPESAEYCHLYLEFDTGEVLDLGKLPVGMIGKQIAKALSRSARCRMTSVIETTDHRIRAPDFAESFHEPRVVGARVDDPFVENTGASTQPIDLEERVTVRGGRRDSDDDPWRDDFIRVGGAPSLAETLIDRPNELSPSLPLLLERTEEADLPPATVLESTAHTDGPGAPLPTISAELVEDEAPTRPPRDPAEESDEFEATVRIDLGRTPPPKLSSTEAA